MNISLFLGIDGITGHPLEKNSRYKPFFSSTGSVIDANGSTIGVPAGMLELCQRLYLEPTISKVACFSHGAFNRNSTFWVTLLRQSLSREKFQALKGHFHVYLHNHFNRVLRDEPRGFLPCNPGKDKIHKMIGPFLKKEELKNALLVDHDEAFISPVEIANNVQICGSHTRFELYERTGPPKNKIWFEGNQACYVAGLIFSCIDVAKKETISLSQALFRFQYKESERPGFYVPQFLELLKDQAIYYRGLEELRKVNPHYTFLEKLPLESLLNPNRENKSPNLSEKLDDYKSAFIGFWEKHEYENALKAIDDMMDLIEKKSGSYVLSVNQVSPQVTTLLTMCCEESILPEIAPSLLPRILNVPLKSHRQACIDKFLTTLPQTLKSEYLYAICKNFWLELMHRKAIKMLSELFLSCQKDLDFHYLILVLHEICISPINKNHYSSIIRVIDQTPQFDSRILLIETLADKTPYSLKKVELLCHLIKQFQQTGNAAEALNVFCDLIKFISTKSIKKWKFEAYFRNILEALTSFGDEYCRTNLNLILETLEAIEDKKLKNCLLAHCYAYFNEKEQDHFFHKLALNTTSISAEAGNYVLITGLRTIENRLKKNFTQAKGKLKLLIFLLNLCDRNAFLSQSEKFLNPVDKFENVKELLCLQQISAKELSFKNAAGLSSLAKIYWKAGLYDLSLGITQILQKEAEKQKIGGWTSLIEPVVYSLVYFQCCHIDDCIHHKDPTQFINKHFTEIGKGVARATCQRRLISASADLKSLESISISILHSWEWVKYEEALQTFKKYSQFSRNPACCKFQCFTLLEICRSSPHYQKSKLIDIALGIKQINFRVYALKALLNIWSIGPWDNENIFLDLAQTYWKTKNYSKSLKYLKRIHYYYNEHERFRKLAMQIENVITRNQILEELSKFSAHVSDEEQ